MARSARKEIPMHLVGVLELLEAPQMHVLQDSHNGGLPMNGCQCYHVLQDLAGLGDEIRDVQHFERMSRKRRVRVSDRSSGNESTVVTPLFLVQLDLTSWLNSGKIEPQPLCRYCMLPAEG